MLDSVYFEDEDGTKYELLKYTYDEKGIRTSKTYEGVTTYYTTVDGVITSQYELDADGNVTNQMLFLYDSYGNLLGFTYNGKTYFYLTNHMGDVIGITDESGNLLAEYYYDAWGQSICTYIHTEYYPEINADEISTVNPMRYRGYYFDTDLGAYYLQSRYYMPDVHRFLNADLPEYAKEQKGDPTGTNLFAYCCNDPVNNSDSTGYKSSMPGKKTVGWGIQIDLSAGFAICSVTVGLEFIWFTDSYHKGNKYAPYIYFYSSIGLGASSKSNSGTYTKAKDYIKNKLKNITNKKPSKISGIKSLFSFSISISVFKIYGFKSSKNGYKKFKSASSYCGPFLTTSGTLFGVKGFISVSDMCFVFGIGVDSSKFSAYYSNSYYWLLNKPSGEFTKLYKEIKKKV